MSARFPAILALTVSTAVACSARADGPPRIEVDRTACAHCGMLISEPVFAAAYRAPHGEGRVFDDIACLLEAASHEQDKSGLRFWFHDAASSEWIDGGIVTFVQSASMKTPMGGGIVAYGDQATATRAATEKQGRLVRTIGELLQTRGAGGGA